MTACGVGRLKDRYGLHDSGGTSSSTGETHPRRHCQAGEHARQLEAGLTASPAAGSLLGGRVGSNFQRHGNDGELGLRPFHKTFLREMHRLAIDVKKPST